LTLREKGVEYELDIPDPLFFETETTALRLEKGADDE